MCSALVAMLMAGAGGHEAAKAGDLALGLSVGGHARIALPDNGPAGSQWQIERTESSNLDIIRITDESTHQSAGAKARPATVHYWSFDALVPGRARMVLVYRYTGEEPPPQQLRYDVTITVTGSK